MLSFLTYDIECGELMMRDDFTDTDIQKRWEISGGDWLARDGRLYGCIRRDGGGLIYSRQQFYGNILLDFYGRLIPPCANDLNFTFRADGWDYEHNDASIGYIGGLNGWWTNQAGLEKYPGCKLRALSGFRAETGREYHIQTGIVDATCFLFVDGELVVTLSDPEPIQKEGCGRVGLGVYCSQAEFRDLKVYRPAVCHVERHYQAEF